MRQVAQSPDTLNDGRYKIIEAHPDSPTIRLVAYVTSPSRALSIAYDRVQNSGAIESSVYDMDREVRVAKYWKS